MSGGGTMKIEVRVLEILKEGPATTADIAEELQKPRKNTCAYLCNLRKHGHVKKWGELRSGRGPVETIWAIT